MSASYSGACFCGAVGLRVSGQPNVMGYCHCRSCRSWSGGPVNAFSLWSPEAVEVTRGCYEPLITCWICSAFRR
ncbi:GFA family protein [Roseomonas marmotae]|nr:GFA family protein [Roseomonas marmotae]